MLSNTTKSEFLEYIATASQQYGEMAIASRVSTIVSPKDTMFGLSHRNPVGYFLTGAAALPCIRAAMSFSQLHNVENILDFGCGHGRVGRWLCAAWPDAELVGAELLPDAVDFYAKNFSAKGWLTNATLRENFPNEQFDLIWVGSVFTHLPEYSASTLLQLLLAWLKPGGVVVFSSHGRIASSAFSAANITNLDPDRADKAIEQLSREEYGFSPYKESNHYGMSFIPMSWYTDQIQKDPFVRLTLYSEGAWAGHQDVGAIAKLPARYIRWTAA